MRLLILILFFSICHFVSAETGDGDSLRHWGVGLQLQPSEAVIMDQYQKKWMEPDQKSMSFGLEFRHVSLPADSNAYDADYGYPTLGVAAKYSINNKIKMHRFPDEDWPLIKEVDYDSRMGNSFSVYGFFSRPFFRTKHWEADYQLNIGVGYCHDKYNTKDAIDNELIGSHWNIFFGGGLHLSYHVLPEWTVRAGLEYWHLSNGALYRPNKGANFIGPSLTLCYEPYYPSIPKKHIRRQPFERYAFADITVGVAARTLREEWNQTQFGLPPEDPKYRTDEFHHYMAYTAQASLLYRYARRWASGIEADIFYGDYADRLEEFDEAAGRDLPHSPWSTGLGFKHEAYYHNFKVSMSFGWYLYREMGHLAKRSEKPYYERVGVQYVIPRLNGLAVGFSVKAHSAKADYTELVLSYPIRFKTQK